MKKAIPLTILAVAATAAIIFSLSRNLPQEQTWGGNILNYFETKDDYIKFVTDNVRFKDIKIEIVKIEKKNNFWKIAKDHGVNIDTLIAANPHLDSLNASINQQVIVPNEKGALSFISSLKDIDAIAQKYKTDSAEIVIQELRFHEKYLYRYKRSEKPIAVFIKNRKPLPDDMTDSLAKQFALREMFRSPLGGRYSSYFGKRIDPFFRTDAFHNGLDIAARYGTPVGASRRGRVISAGWNGGYGKAVIIDHGDGYRTLYGHLSTIAVREGMFVEAGRFVGRVGSTGLSTGPHLHFTLWHNNRLINPMKVLW